MNAFALRLLAVSLLVAGLPAHSANPAPNFTQTAGGPETASGDMFRRADGAVYSLLSDRIFKTTDGGVNWTLLGGKPPSKAVSLTFSGTDLFAAGLFGVMRSTNDGVAWTDFNGSGNSALPFATAERVFAAGNFIYAVGNDGAVLFRSPASGAAWNNVTPPGIGENGVGAATVAGSNLCVLVGNSGVRFSGNGGDTWSSSAGAGGSFRAIVTSAANADTVFIANSGGILRSTNDCAAFSSVGSATAGLLGVSINSLGTDSAGHVYAGMSDGGVRMSTNPANSSAVYAAINGGSLPAATGVGINSMVTVTGGILAGTTGLGANFGDGTSNWTRRSSGLKGGAINALLDRGPASQFAASSGGMQFTANGGTSYTESNTGLNLRSTGSVARVGNTYVLSAFQANNGQGTAAPGLFLSTDAGANWAQLTTGSGLPADANIGDVVTDGTSFYATVGSGNPRGVYKSADGAAWTIASSGLPANPSFRNLAARGTKLWAYVGNVGVFRSTNAAASWENVTNELSGELFGKVFASPTSLIASAGGVVFRSANDGDSWSATTGFAISRFGIELESLAEDTAGVLYLGDEHAGLSVSKDGGAHWTPASQGLATSTVCIERINALLFKDNKIYAGQGEGGGVSVANPVGAATPADTIGCTTDTDTWPNNFFFAAQNNVPASSTVTSSQITVAGLGAGVQAPIRVTGGEYSITATTCTNFTTAAGTVQNGDKVCVRHTSAATSESATSTRLFIGNAATLGENSATFTSSTGLVFTGRTDEINTSFGANGFAHLANLTAAADLRVLGDGSVVMAVQTNGFPSDLALVKFHADGTLDTTFGANGVAQVDAGGNENTVAVVVLSSGKLLAVANTSIGNPAVNKIALVRFTSAGQPDNTFGTNGVVLYDTTVSTTERAASAIALANDTFLVGGHLTLTSNGAHLFVAKFAADGSPDNAFGTSGLASIQIGGSSSNIGSMALQGDGKILVVGQGDTGFNTFHGVVARFTSAGAIDTSFGSNGQTVVNASFSLLGVAVLPGGKIMAVGQGGNPFSPVVARLTSGGALDNTFDGDGVAVLTLAAPSTSGGFNSIAVLANGSIAITGNAFQSDISTNVLLFTILTSAGALDPNFGPNGQGYVLRRPLNGNSVTGTPLQQRSDGGVVIGGQFGNETAAFVYGGQVVVTPPDTTPDAFDFIDQQNVEPLAVVVSNAVTISGINAAATVTVSGGEFSVTCNGTFGSAAGSITSGQSVCVRHTAALAFGGTQTTTLTIGGVAATFASTVRAADTVPDDFAFVDQSGVNASTVITSAAVTITGFDGSLAVNITGGTFAVGTGSCGSTFGATGNISNGQKLCVRHTSSATAGGHVDSTVTIGGKSDTFTSTTFTPPPPDTTPDAFHFVDVTDVATQTTIVSNTITVGGIDAAAAVTVTGGEYAVGADACGTQFTSAAGSITNGQKICVRHNSSAQPGTAVNTTLTIGGVPDTFTSTTASAGEPDTTPDAFHFTDVDGLDPGVVAISDAVTIAGINSPAPISISGGKYSIGDGAFTSGAGTISNGQQVRVRVTASTDFNGKANGVLTVGGVIDTFTATTRAANKDSVADPAGRTISFTAADGVLNNLTNTATRPAGAPANLFYPHGFFSFNISGLVAGATTTIKLVLPSNVRPTGYLKCIAGACSPFPGVTISGHTITLTLTDGGAGDADGVADGVITDPGAPIAAAPPAPTTTTDSGGALNPLLLLGLALLGMRRRQLQR